MKNTSINQDAIKSKALTIFEYVLLVFCLCILILRVIYTEGPTMQTSSISVMASDSLYSLYVSGCLFASFIVWLVWSFCGRKFSYRTTGIGIGLCIFCVAAVISGFAAADKRLAINNIVSLFTPIFCAILLVQILDTTTKIRLVLAVIAALGAVSAYQCADQLLFLNKESIRQYEENPDMMLEPLNIQKNTFQHFLFEQRLYSNNTKAFFTTRNSAGSFFLMAVFALLALTIESERPLKLRALFTILIIAIFLTKSKGAIIGLFLGMSMFALYLKFGSRLKAHRKIMAAAFMLLIALGLLIITWYGKIHQTLPGGISMLVRWQYWQASAVMFMDHFLTGVGPGNFSNYYPHYKPAAALESVTDPHNFPLSILTQYGPLGLAGFLAMIFLPLWKITKSGSQVSTQQNDKRNIPARERTAATIILCTWFGLLLAILTLAPAVKSGDIRVVIYIIIRYYLPPLAVFCISLYFIRKYTYTELDNERNVVRRNAFAAIIFCALLGVLLHNLTDYAIFEPGIYTTFWFLLAALIAMNVNNKNQKCIVFTPAPYLKITVILGAIALCVAFLSYALIPVASSTAKIKLANKAFSYGRFDQAHNLLDLAAQDDKLSSFALSLNARMYMDNARRSSANSFYLLLFSEQYLREAVKRNDAGFKNYEDLSDAYIRLSEVSDPNEQTGWLILAFDAASKAKDRYEGNERLHFNLAQIAERLGRTEAAIEYYQKTVEIENLYRVQFRRMYPKENIVSRLGEDKYQFAIKRTDELTPKGGN
ncbi:MAG: O-antigen ligase family protein [Sedimentisphaerales bacterium]|nr:O-antigen ligase family protein [Sedimentisphaerales bacterium]